ncbi:Riboflavin-binding protein RibY [subsurface metagenome]
MGKEVNIINTYSIIPMASAAIIASDTLVHKNPELVRRFIRAVVRAGNYVLDNRENVIFLLKKYIPTLSDKNIDINKKVLSASLDLWKDEDIEKYGLGYTTKSDWEMSINEMYSLGLIKRRIDPDECFTNEFIK